MKTAHWVTLNLAPIPSYAINEYKSTCRKSAPMQVKQALVLILSSLGLWTSPDLAAQLPVPRVEKVVQTADENPMDTVSKFGGTLGLNLSQTALENWAGGGESSLAFTALSKLSKTLEKGARSAGWEVDLALGLLRQQGTWRKTDDRIVLTGQWNTAMQSKLNGGRLSALIDARTQFLPGYAVVDGLPDRSQRISDFMSPGYLVGAAGFAPKKGDRHQFFFSPFTGKLTVLMDDTLSAAGAFGVPAGQHFRLELGGYLRWNLKWNLMENVNWTHQVDLFSNYLDSPGNIDVNWTGLLELKINASLRTTISTHLIYDNDVILEKESARTETNDQGVTVEIPARLGPGTQFKEVLSVGFSYSL